MSLKFFLFLIKNKSQADLIKKRYYFNLLLFFSMILLFITYYSNRDDALFFSMIIGIFASVSLLFYLYFDSAFLKLLKNSISNSDLSDSEVDKAFSSFQNGYLNSIKKHEIADKIIYFARLSVSFILVLGFLAGCIVANFFELDLAVKIDGLLNALIWIVIALSIVGGFFKGLKDGFWYQKYGNEIAVIKRYKAIAKLDDKQSENEKYSIFQDKKQKERLSYLFNDKSLYQRVLKLLKIWQILFFALTVGYIVIFFVFNALSALFNFPIVITAIITVFFLIDIIAFGVFWQIFMNRIYTEQFDKMLQSPSENRLPIALHVIRQKRVKWQGLILIFGMSFALISNLLIGYLVYSIAKTTIYSIYFFLLFMLEATICLTVIFIIYANSRKQMKPIEDEIDSIISTKISLNQ